MENTKHLIKTIENETDFDVLNYDEYSIDVINRLGSDDRIDTVQIYGKTEEEVINYLKRL